MKLLDTKGGNTKIRKTNGGVGIRYAGLSMMPNDKLCPFSKCAGCFDDCLKSAGRGAMSNVAKGRQRKADLFMYDREEFLRQLRKELTNFQKVCEREGVQPVVRLNVLSDVMWEKLNIPQQFPKIQFLDYTKIAARLTRPLPNNYKLIFSYSGRKNYQPSVDVALQTDRPMAVVFKNKLPSEFMGRTVVDGDKSDWDNVNAGAVVIGLLAKGKAKQSVSDFVVDL